ncbi:hypothetical protein [Terrabacter carboxydivorans]|uniref:Uncharacterized protein n=1 Tax=Terrabacter carboxydivorans TaxID=619730 RepID=A0ABP5YSE9_9MICO
MRERRSFTIRGDATPREIASASKCVLLELWDELEFFDIDLAGLEAQVDYEAHPAALEHRRRRHFLSKRLDTSAHLLPGRDDDLLPLVLPLLPLTVGSTGFSRIDRCVVFGVDDEGSVCVFDLTPEQLRSVRDRLLADGATRDLLVPMRQH